MGGTCACVCLYCSIRVARRGVARDIGGADPERMTPLRTAAYLRDVFAGSAVAVRVLDDRAALQREYPLLAAVDRAAASVERHRGEHSILSHHYSTADSR